MFRWFFLSTGARTQFGHWTQINYPKYWVTSWPQADAQCSILLVTRVVFNITFGKKWIKQFLLITVSKFEVIEGQYLQKSLLLTCRSPPHHGNLKSRTPSNDPQKHCVGVSSVTTCSPWLHHLWRGCRRWSWGIRRLRHESWCSCFSMPSFWKNAKSL